MACSLVIKPMSYRLTRFMRFDCSSIQPTSWLWTMVDRLKKKAPLTQAVKLCNKQTVDPGIACAEDGCTNVQDYGAAEHVKQHDRWLCEFALALWMQSKTNSKAYLAVRFILFMSPSSSRNFSSSSRIVSTLVFKRTMRFLMRRILSSNNVVTCKHKCMSDDLVRKGTKEYLTTDKCQRRLNILAAPCDVVAFAPD